MKQEDEQPQLTAEEITARKEKMKANFEMNIPYLEVQLKYETLLCNIDEIRFRRDKIQLEHGSMLQSVKQAQDEANAAKEAEKAEK